MLDEKLKDKKNLIVINTETLSPILFRQKGKWYDVEGKCDGCARGCCVIAPYSEFDDGTGKCKKYVNGVCTVHFNKPYGCFTFPCGTEEQYDERFREILKECKFKVKTVDE